MSSEVLSRPVSHGAACGGGRWMIFCWWSFFFLATFLSPSKNAHLSFFRFISQF
jgi:hypothetical protein